MATLKQPIFNDGEPLDASKLNDLKDGLTKTYQIAQGLQNTLEDGTTTVPVISAGSITIPALTAAAGGPSAIVDLPVDAKFNGETPIYTISIGGGSIDSKRQITLRIINSKQVQYFSNGPVGELKINYIAFKEKAN